MLCLMTWIVFRLTGDAPRIGKPPEKGARNRSDSDLTETNDSCDSGASGTNSGGADEDMPLRIVNDADTSEGSGETEICADVHVNGASKSSSTDSSVHANADDNDSTVESVIEKTSSAVKSVGRAVRVAPSGPRAKRRLLQNHADSDQDKENDGDGVISKVCKELSKTLEDDEQSNSSESSFDKWCPMFKIAKETPVSRNDTATMCRSKEREDTRHSGSGAKSGRVTKLNSASKAARSATKSRNTRVSRLDSSDEVESSGNSDDETEVSTRSKSASSSGKLLRRLSSSESAKSRGFLRIKLSSRNNKQRAVRKKIVGPRKRQSLPERRLNGNAGNSDNHDDSDDNPTVIDTSFRPSDTDFQITNCSVVIGDDISPLRVSAAKKRHKLNLKKKSRLSLPQDLDDESDLGGVSVTK